MGTRMIRPIQRSIKCEQMVARDRDQCEMDMAANTQPVWGPRVGARLWHFFFFFFILEYIFWVDLSEMWIKRGGPACVFNRLDDLIALKERLAITL